MTKITKFFLVLPLLVVLAGFPGLLVAQEEGNEEGNGEEITEVASEPLGLTIVSPADGLRVQVNESVSFLAEATGGRSPYAFVWNFGDNTSFAGAQRHKSYDTAGEKLVRLAVTDLNGDQVSETVTVIVGEVTPPPPEQLVASITSPASGFEGKVGEAVSFAATATGGNSPYAFVWNFGDSTSFSGQTYSKTYTAAGTYSVVLAVTDLDGGQATANFSLKINPSGGGGGGVGADKTPPTAPTITSSSIPANSTTTPQRATIVWSASTDPEVANEERSGLDGYSYIWNQNASANPDSVVETGETTLIQPLTQGNWWFHLVAVDKAGNISSPVTTFGPIIIEGVGPAPTKPVISNIRVTDVGQTTATIRWTTDIPANSRVIYDLSSHKDIGQSTFPNFGYAFSSEILNGTNKVTEHAVPLTGLQSNTTYFFRVLSQS